MTELIDVDVARVLDGIINAPSVILQYLFTHDHVSMYELERVVEPQSRAFVADWVQRMTFYLAVEQYVQLQSGMKTYKLSPFARDMIKYIQQFNGNYRLSK